MAIAPWDKSDQSSRGINGGFCRRDRRRRTPSPLNRGLERIWKGLVVDRPYMGIDRHRFHVIHLGCHLGITPDHNNQPQKTSRYKKLPGIGILKLGLLGQDTVRAKTVRLLVTLGLQI